MDKKSLVSFAKLNGSPIARSSMKAGNYIGEKTSDQYRIIGKVDGQWKPIDKETKVEQYLCFSMVTNVSNGLPMNISVPLEFTEIPLKSKFPFKVDDKGYTSVSLEILTNKQVKSLKAEIIE